MTGVEGAGGRTRPRAIVGIVAVAALGGALAGAISARFLDRSPSASSGSGACAAVAPPTSTSAGDVAADDVPAVVAATRPSVVSISVSATRFEDDGEVEFVRVDGTGVVIDEAGLVATNAHIVEAGGRVEVTLPDGDTADGSVVGVDHASDLAVVDVGVEGLAPIRFGCSGSLEVGETVVALGNALALGGDPTASVGTIAALDRAIETEASRAYTGLIQLDMAVNEGQSGGPLVDLSGSLVGITSVGLTGGSNVGFAIGADDAGPILDALVVDAGRSPPDRAASEAARPPAPSRR